MRPGPFVVNVADLVHHPGGRRHVRREGALEGKLAVTSGSLAPGAMVAVDVMLEAVSEGILATGEVVAPYVGECRRCLGPVRGELRADVQELFAERSRDPEEYSFGHDQVDLEPMVREAVVLGLPLAPLCRQTCLGLCPRCGADLNEGACRCTPDDRDPRWAALDALRRPDEV